MWILFIIISALFLGLNSVITKNCLRKEHTLPTIFCFSFLTCLLSLIFFRKIDFTPSLSQMMFIVAKSVLLAVSWYLVFHSLKRMEISVHAPLRNISSVFLLFLGYLILGEKLSIMQYLGVGIIIIGAYVIELHHIRHFFEPFKYFKEKNALMLMVSLILISFCSILDKIILNKTGTNLNTLLFFNYFFVALIYFGIIYFKGYISDIPMLYKQDLSLIVLISAFAFIADISYFFVAAMPAVPISLIIPLKRFSTLISVLVGGAFFQEERILHKAACTAIMILGVFVLIL